MIREFRTTPSKLGGALRTLHPKHSNVRGSIIRVMFRLRLRVACTGLHSCLQLTLTLTLTLCPVLVN